MQVVGGHLVPGAYDEKEWQKVNLCVIWIRESYMQIRSRCSIEHKSNDLYLAISDQKTRNNRAFICPTI